MKKQERGSERAREQACYFFILHSYFFIHSARCIWRWMAAQAFFTVSAVALVSPRK
jgi:hypothetical protein